MARAAATTTTATRPAEPRTSPARPAVTHLVIQCCSGKVKAAPASAHTVQSTDTGAAALAPSPRVTRANST